MSSDKRDKNWSNIVVTISTAIFAIVSIITVYISVTSWQVQREAARPYFTFKESPAVQLDENLSFEFKFSNVGTHPASCLASRTFIFDQRLLKKPILIDDYTVINDIPRDTTMSLLLNIDDKDIWQKSDLNSQFVIINLSYTDPIIRKSYTQTLYLKWAGIIARKPQPFVHVEANEKDAILNYLKSNHFFE
jgi:hypothetical protein